VLGDAVFEQDAVAAEQVSGGGGDAAAGAVLSYLASDAWVGASEPAVSRSAMRRQCSCMEVRSASIWVSRSWISWNAASGLPNRMRCPA